jgi:hypothetical protein
MLDQDAEALLATEPIGLYVVEQRGRWLLVWRISEGESDEAAPGPKGASEASVQSFRAHCTPTRVRGR